MNKQEQKRISKFLSLVLRHQPKTIGLELDSSGWVDVSTLIDRINEHDRSLGLNLEQLKTVVADNDKQRFQFNEYKTKIRATQGHSVDIELGYESAVPPETLCHGTPQRFVSSIREQGLIKQQRHHVHLHCDASLAKEVGGRRGQAVLLIVRAREMHDAGFEFFVSPNQVWLTDHVPAEFIDFPQ